MIPIVGTRIAIDNPKIIFSVPITGCNGTMRPVQRRSKIMNIFIFIIFAMILLCGILCLVLILAKCDNIKQLDFHISLKNGIEFKSLFYRQQ